MKYSPLLILGLALSSATFAAPEKRSDSSSIRADVAAVVQLERDAITAIMHRDAARLLRLGPADGWFISSSGSVDTLKDFADEVRSGAYKVQSMHLDRLQVRVYGDIAVAIGLEIEQSSDRGKDSSGQFRFTDTWQKHNGHWRLIASANMPAPAKH
jgi:uncharacterized protein (TIGR02246 family)